MPALASDLRRQLESVCVQARDVAEAAARSALQKRAVDAAEPFPHMAAAERELRNRLRARGRQAGDARHENKTQAIQQLTQELAYEYWHRMLFARFLAENHLLMHPDGVAVSLEECEELAAHAKPQAANGFVLAARYASAMLPQIFRTEDVLLDIEFAPEQRLALEKLLASLPRETFLADDSLGWVYQFWQTEEKKRVNESGEKIDGRTLSAVTQLFTEHYMVQFLLHNTIGAWWAGRQGTTGEGAGVSSDQCPVEMEYLRWHEGKPAAGTFPGWPTSLKDFTLLDPCCGSGHFLVAAFQLLVPLRMHDEGLSARAACDAVLRDNLFGLELDPRCTQIAAFALALVAWKYPEAGGYRPLPQLNIACSGQGVVGKRDEWLALANGDSRLHEGMNRLYDLFERAQHLGSLIDPRREAADVFSAGYAELQPLLAKVLARKNGDADVQSVGVAAQGITRAAELLAGQYTLIITNVPYLGQRKQGAGMKRYIDEHFELGKADLANAFIFRAISLCRREGTVALVTPNSWLFQTSSTTMRDWILKQTSLLGIVALGEEAWWSFGIRGPRTVLVIATIQQPPATNRFFGIDVSTNRGEQVIYLEEKAARLANREPTLLRSVCQSDQLSNPDVRIHFGQVMPGTLLCGFIDSAQGIKTGDDEKWRRCFWELPCEIEGWVFYQSSGTDWKPFQGASFVLDWRTGGKGMVRPRLENIVQGRPGVAISPIGKLPAALYLGERFESSVAPLVPKDPTHLPALWSFVTSIEYRTAVRAIDKKLSVTTDTLAKVPFDVAHWQEIAAEQYPNGLPEPHSDDPTQWLFKGDIARSTDQLQVAVVRLLGYRWPEQPRKQDAVDKLADADGIVPISGVRGEAPAAERLLEVLQAAYGEGWSDAVLHRLLTDAGAKAGSTLDDWLRNQFFEAHTKQFHTRPFIWHIWDGRTDGLAVLVNYHKLDHQTLNNLTYSYLGDWIKLQADDARAGRTGADGRLDAAQKLQEKLKLILAGEKPYDIFVRWKPLSQQAIGWHPDLNDGVRMNIRPFVEADILRKRPNIKWTKDRGKEPKRDPAEYPWFNAAGDRVNDVHLTNEQKTQARTKAGK